MRPKRRVSLAWSDVWCGRRQLAGSAPGRAGHQNQLGGLVCPKLSAPRHDHFYPPSYSPHSILPEFPPCINLLLNILTLCVSLPKRRRWLIPCPHNENLVGQMLHISASSVQATKQQQAFERWGEKTIWDLRIFGK